MKPIKSVITGCGAYLPERVMTNAELARMVDTSDEWIVERTGIRQRHIAAEGELTSDLATKAASAALARAGCKVEDLDLIVLATTTPDETFPATATRVQNNLGLRRGAAFDVQAVCSGFIYAMAVADSMIRGGMGAKALVIGAETMSRILDWNDRGTCVLFGDGAGAVVLEADQGGKDRGVLATRLHSDGAKHDLLFVDGGPSSTRTTGYLRMEGKEVFRHAVTNLSGVVKEVLDDARLGIDQVDWLVPHQANKRILDGTAKKLGLDASRVIVTVDKHGNTSAASVPLALDTGLSEGRIKPGQVVLMEAMGGGFTWGACLARW